MLCHPEPITLVRQPVACIDIVTQELFKFEYLDESDDGKIIGEFRPSGLRPYTLEKARQFGFDQAYLEACL